MLTDQRLKASWTEASCSGLRHKWRHVETASGQVVSLFERFCLLHLAENGVDGLQFTRSWLTRSAERIKTSQLASEPAAAASPAAESEASASSSTPASSSTANAVINAAFFELLDWDDDRVFPEVISTPSFTLRCTDPVGLETGMASSLSRNKGVTTDSTPQCGEAHEHI